MWTRAVNVHVSPRRTDCSEETIEALFTDVDLMSMIFGKLPMTERLRLLCINRFFKDNPQCITGTDRSWALKMIPQPAVRLDAAKNQAFLTKWLEGGGPSAERPSRSSLISASMTLAFGSDDGAVPPETPHTDFSNWTIDFSMSWGFGYRIRSTNPNVLKARFICPAEMFCANALLSEGGDRGHFHLAGVCDMAYTHTGGRKGHEWTNQADRLHTRRPQLYASHRHEGFLALRVHFPGRRAATPPEFVIGREAATMVCAFTRTPLPRENPIELRKMITEDLPSEARRMSHFPGSGRVEAY